MWKRKAEQANGTGEARCFVDKVLKKSKRRLCENTTTWAKHIGTGLFLLKKE